MAANIENLLFMETNPEGRTLTIDEFERFYPLRVTGVNVYVGLNVDARQRWETTGSVLKPDHRAIMSDLRDHLLAGDKSRGIIDLGLWPYEATDPYVFVLNNRELVEAVAEELAVYQVEAQQGGKTMGIVVRYASEMNDPATIKQPWGRHPGVPDDEAQQILFRSSFRMVREVFRGKAPDIKFTFSPAIRADVAAYYAFIAKYWPGNDLVDSISCTWYVGKEEDVNGAVAVMKQYCRDHQERKLLYGIDEIGGINGTVHNDAILSRMFSALSDFEPEGITFNYVSLFLLDKWGADATLNFLGA